MPHDADKLKIGKQQHGGKFTYTKAELLRVNNAMITSGDLSVPANIADGEFRVAPNASAVIRHVQEEGTSTQLTPGKK